jgi:hypothetical protein
LRKTAYERGILGGAKPAFGHGTCIWRLLSADADAAKVAPQEKAMDVLEAVSTAKKHILKVFEDENISHLGLEEAFFDESKDIWHVTLGFSRPWDNPQSALQSAAQILNPGILKRSYKIVEISDKDNRVTAVKNYSES